LVLVSVKQYSPISLRNSVYNEAHFFYCQCLDVTQHEGFMAITAHGITPDWKILDLLIGMPAVEALFLHRKTNRGQFLRPPCEHTRPAQAFRQANEHHSG
ncbi:hypothetical protein VP01_6990g1, partial [Puccinia sorghi]